ncbi:MAG: sigma-70 family RNA polymerase sigma factor [Acidimicrobiales bacterium]
MDEPARAQGVDDVTALLVGLYPQLVATLRMYNGNAAMAEDVAQEALARAWERREQLEVMTDPRSWVFRVAMNRVRSLHRRLRLELRYSGASRNDVRGDSTLEMLEDTLVIRAALGKLPRRQCSAIALRYYGDLSVEETAKVMGCAQGTVKALTSQALATLRSQLGGESDGTR